MVPSQILYFWGPICQRFVDQRGDIVLSLHLYSGHYTQKSIDSYELVIR